MKTNLILLLSSLSFYLNSTNQAILDPKVEIVSIENISASKVVLKKDKKNQIAEVNSAKKLFKNIEIPTISLATNHQRLVDFIRQNNNKELPKSAIKIITVAGKFGIWHDESGIHCAKKIKNNFEEKIEQNLKLENYQKALQIVQIILLIDRNGTPVLKIN